MLPLHPEMPPLVAGGWWLPLPVLLLKQVVAVAYLEGIAEPAAGEPEVITCVIRMPDGSRCEPTQTLRTMHAELQTRSKVLPGYQVSNLLMPCWHAVLMLDSARILVLLVLVLLMDT